MTTTKKKVYKTSDKSEIRTICIASADLIAMVPCPEAQCTKYDCFNTLLYRAGFNNTVLLNRFLTLFD